ncbi:MAG: site-2 protease family protein [Phycisphaerales bacterium JB039]
MTGLPGFLGLLIDLAVVIFGFGLIIFVHELGHFLAARWAGIRTLAFAIGFGPALVSYRKGLGWRRGSSEPEYLRLLQLQGNIETCPANRRGEAVSHTEYRLNALPFGGYVKMLGQDDLNPAATSHVPDSYQSTPPWKRMIVISAGVVMNIVTAAILFVLVFTVGLETEPPRIGALDPSGPAAGAVAINADEAGAGMAGLRPGDEMVRINDRRPNSFNDLIMASAMARRGQPVELAVQRAGLEAPLIFQIVPQRSDLTGLLDLGVEPPRSPTLIDAPDDDATREALRAALDRFGLTGVAPGMTLTHVQQTGGDAQRVEHAADLATAFRTSRGEPVTLTFESPTAQARVTLDPAPVLQTTLIPTPDKANSRTPVDHLLGFTPVMAVLDASDRGAEQGLRDGDIFARIGEVMYPSVFQGAAEIRANRGRTVPISVLRRPAPGAPLERVDLEVSVKPSGTIGFYMTDVDEAGAGLWMAMPPAGLGDGGAVARRIIDRAGMRLVSADGKPVATLADLRAALLSAADARPGEPSVELLFELPLPADPQTGARPTESRTLTLKPDEALVLRDLGWESPVPMAMFEPDQFILKAENPAHAVSLGLSETYRVMAMTYATFLRLIEGTVKVEHLKGPVGIAHLGTRIASRGLIWLLFFMALVSVNLAVINFLPLPIVDGGQFLFLLSEQIRGKPVPVAVQSMATMAGLVLIGAVFLLVTFNDIKALLGG